MRNRRLRPELTALEERIALTGDIPPLNPVPPPIVPTLGGPPSNPPAPTDPGTGPGTGLPPVGPVGGVGDGGTNPSEPPPQVDLGGSGTADPGGLPDEPTDPDNPYPDNPYPDDDPGYDAGDDDNCGPTDLDPGSAGDDAPVYDKPPTDLDPGSAGDDAPVYDEPPTDVDPGSAY